MDANTMVSLVREVGFPIVMCGVLVWFIYHMMENHRTESQEFTKAINNNTLVIQKLVDKLDGE